MKFLLDTDHCIFLLRQDANVRQAFAAHADDACAVSIVSAAELLFGAHWSSKPAQNLAAVNALLDALLVLPVTRSIGNRFGQLKATLLRSGSRLEDFDLLIASTALEFDVPLVTHNIRHYERIDGLRIEDWRP